MNLPKPASGLSPIEFEGGCTYPPPSNLCERPLICIDWLQLNTQIDRTEHTWNSLYEEKEVKGQTPMFSKVSEIWFKGGKRICTIAYSPKTPVMHPNMHLIKFDNWLLYANDLYEFITEFLTENNIEFKNITQLDISGDFNQFINHRKPENLIRSYLSGQYCKIGRGGYSTNGNYSTNGQNKYEITYDYIRFGSAKSAITTKLYNKKKELTQKTDKPWIREAWEKNGINTNSDVWRLEFSIKTSRAGYIDTETGEFNATNLDMLKPENYQAMFKTCYQKYFQFAVMDKTKHRKDRMRKIELFKDMQVNTQYLHYLEKLSSNRAEKIYAKKLKKENDTLRQLGKNNQAETVLQVLKQHISDYNLHEWYAKQVEFAGIDIQRIDYTQGDLHLDKIPISP